MQKLRQKESQTEPKSVEKKVKRRKEVRKSFRDDETFFKKFKSLPLALKKEPALIIVEG